MSDFPSIGPEGDKLYSVGNCWHCRIPLYSRNQVQRYKCGPCGYQPLDVFTSGEEATLAFLARPEFADMRVRVTELKHPILAQRLAERGYLEIWSGDVVMITDRGRTATKSLGDQA
jgi:hypothetical protein